MDMDQLLRIVGRLVLDAQMQIENMHKQITELSSELERRKKLDEPVQKVQRTP